MSNKAMGMISLCRKAGKLKTGFDAVKETVQKGEASLVLYAADLSEKTRSSMDWELEKAFDPPNRRILAVTMEELSTVCGKRTGVLAVLDDGLAGAIEKLILQSNEEDSNL
ncbi:MAG: ribosomal L7Ae/L30e/S12e/Gadd45 family protein [Angelakisella sp.]|nr:ribosomal L7Ae/L30e/S12e/Gadd45 family protein [Angelakisella sp.]